MIHTEKAVLGLLCFYPKLIPIVRENEDSLFSDETSRIVYGKICELYEDGITPDLAVLYDMLQGRVPATWISELADFVLGVSGGMAEKVLIEKIGLLKHARANRELRAKLKTYTNLNEVEYDEIIAICERAKINLTKEESSDFVSAYYEYLDWKEMKPTRITTGFPSFDKLTDHFNYGEIVAIMGRTTTGKTFVGLNILENLLNSEIEDIGFFSMEMSKATLIERIMQIRFGFSRADLVIKRATGELNIDDFLRKYEKVKVFSNVYSVDEVAAIVDKERLKVVIIDYFQLMKNEEGLSIYEKATYKMQRLKEMAKNKHIVIFLMIQLSRKGEGGWEPVSIDMARDSGAIEENADFIIGLWNPSLHPSFQEKPDEDLKGKIFMKLLKNKRGPVVGIECNFNPATGKIYEID